VITAIALAASPLVIIGFLIFFILRKLIASKASVAVGVVVLTPLCAAFAYDVIIDCDNSFYLKSVLTSSLTKEEFSTLQPNRVICPTVYEFMKNGKSEDAEVVSDFIHGPKIYWSWDSNG
jgi:predicted neutral ceramidase superfamily lipid hydrolase